MCISRLLSMMVFPAGALTIACDQMSASSNRDAGFCPMAKCLGDDAYPPTCSRVPRFTLQPYYDPSIVTVSSNDPPPPMYCCEVLCHLEYPNGEECLPNGACEDFACCASNGNPIMESFPAQCHDPLSGRTFTDQGRTFTDHCRAGGLSWICGFVVLMSALAAFTGVEGEAF